LYDIISESNTDRKVYHTSGDSKSVDRETIRIDGNTSDCIIVASLGVFSTGINLPGIENVIIGHPMKSKLVYLQSIGRGLRLKEGKEFCRLFDIGDNLTYKRKSNHTFKHFGERMNLLTSEGHEFNIVNVDFK
jgi:superfamily II DNA or RNA helicase